MPHPPTAWEHRLDSVASEVSEERRSRLRLEQSVQALRAELALLAEKVGNGVERTLRSEDDAAVELATGTATPGYGNSGVEASKPTALGDGGRDGGAGRESASTSSRDEFEEISLQESVWDSAVLMFLPGVGWAGSLMLLSAIVVNIFLQVVFVYICAGSAFENQLPSPDDAKKWRITDGHREEYMDTGGFVSLAARVCGGDNALTFSTSQADLVQTIDNYLSPMVGDTSGHILNSEGGALCFVVLFLWMNTVVNDVRLTIDYLHVICFLPTSRRTVLHTYEEKAILESVSTTRRLCLLLTALFRMGIACTLGYFGARWLCNTIEITDLVLNAAALAFVLEIDEMLFSTFVPLSIGSVLGHLEPLKRPHPRNFKGLDWFSALSFVACLTGAVLIFNYHAADLYTLLGDVNHELCEKGELDFVVQVNTELGFPLMTWTNSYNSDSLTEADIRSSWFRNAVNNTISITEAYPDNLTKAQEVLKDSASVAVLSETRDGKLEGSKSQFGSYQRLGVKSFGVLSCEDQAGESPLLLHYLFDIYSEPEAASCQDLEEYCGQPDASTLRFACARTCGCHTVTSGLFALGGCPEICLEERDQRISAMPCTSADDAHPELKVAASTLAHNWETHPAVGQPNILSSALASGCARAVEELAADGQAWRLDYVCNPLPGRASLAPICPYECGCSDTNTLDGHCPLSCAGQSVPPTSCALGLCPYGDLKRNATIENSSSTCEQWDLYLFARVLTELQCPLEREALQSTCCEPTSGPCPLCPRGTRLLQGSRVPADSPRMANSSCADVEAHIQSEEFCRTHENRPPEWLNACCGGGT